MLSMTFPEGAALARTVVPRIERGDLAALEDACRLLIVLTPAQEKVLRLSFGLGCERRYSTEEIAAEFEVSIARIAQIRRQGLRGLNRIGLGAQFVQRLVSVQHEVRSQPLVYRYGQGTVPIQMCTAVQNILDAPNISPRELRALTPREFEEFIAEIWSRFGYQVELTARTRDGGRDVVAVRSDEAAVRFIVECKRYGEHHKVGVDVVRALYGVKAHEKATKAFVATTSSFTRGAVSFSEDHQWELELRDCDGIQLWLDRTKRFRKGETGLWLPED